MQILKIKGPLRNRFLHYLSGCLLTGVTALFFTSCADTVRAYHPPRFDLTRLGRLGIITFSDNAQPSVAEYTTQ